MAAVVARQLQACRLLLDLGADPRFINCAGRAAYNTTPVQDGEEVYDMLIEAADRCDKKDGYWDHYYWDDQEKMVAKRSWYQQCS